MEADKIVYVEKKRTPLFGIPLYFTTYTISEETINRKRGLLNIVEDDMFMYKVQDVRLKRSLLERIFKLGTVVCYTADVTDKELVFEHIKNAEEIKDYVMRQAEEERRRRRTLHTMGIDASDFDDSDL